MSLSSALGSAKATFNNVGTQTDITSKNIANVSNANYVKRTAMISTTTYGATVATVARAQNEGLFRQTIASSSLYSGQNTLLDGLTDIKSIYGGNNYEAAPATYLTELLKNLQTYAGKPDDAAAAATVVSSAQDVATSIKSAADQIQTMRADIDKQLTLLTDELNELLAQFQTVNTAVTNATALGRDANDALDTRDTLLKRISEIVGVNVVVRPNNDLALYTTQGITLFETVPRTVSFSAKSSYDPTTTAGNTGNAVTIDAVKVQAGTGGNTTATGAIAALLQLRDDTIPVMQTQLDELARSLIEAFAESPASPATSPVLPGLFTWNGATVPSSAAPTSGNTSAIPTTYTPGLANLLQVNKEVVILEGGDPKKLRDGGINKGDPSGTPALATDAYVNNTAGVNGAPAAGYSDLIKARIDALGADMSFSTSTQIETQSSILEFASNSMGWLEQVRKAAVNADESKAAMYQRLNEAYSNNTGVSLDEELSLLLDIEQSYKAAAKLVATVDEMLTALLNIVR